MSKYFREPKSLGGRVKVKLDLSNYPIKSDLKNATGVDTSKFAKKVHLTSLKSNAQWTHLRRFAIDSTSKFHVESSRKLHRF